METTLDLSADVIDVRDIIARFEELEFERDDYMAPNRDGHMTVIGADWAADNADAWAELRQLADILDNLKGYGGDEQWRGDWYPVTLIRDSHFVVYAQDVAEECGMIDRNVKWPHTCIDWERAARELQYDYTSTSIGGVDYWYR